MNLSTGKSPFAVGRILVRGVNWLGDAVMSTPALLRLREAYPDAFIALLTPEKLADLWKNHPAISAILTFAPGESGWRVGRRLRHERFQTALVLPNSFRSAWETWSAQIPERIGYSGQMRSWLLSRVVAPRPGAVLMHKRTRQEVLRLIRSEVSDPLAKSNRKEPIGRSGFVRDNEFKPGPSAHHLHQYLHLVAHLGASSAPVAPLISITPAEVHSALQRLQVAPAPPQPLFALNPGAEYGPAKRWPAEAFIAAAREIRKQTGCRWLVLGGKADVGLASQVTSGIEAEAASAPAGTDRKSVINLAGATSLRDLCAVLSASDVLLTNDTGPMHVAAAVNTRVVTPFGSTSPALTGPGLPGDRRHSLLPANVSCAPCFRRECPIDFRCMRSIKVEHVVRAVLSCWQH